MLNNSGRTRFSIDFRTVHVDDVVARREAPNMNSKCTCTTLRGTDLPRIDEVALAGEGKATAGARPS
jgi:hypothetical protein